LRSFVPGGLGSADLFWGIRLSSLAGGHDRVVAALLLYRLVYYVLPFLVATVVLGGAACSDRPADGGLRALGPGHVRLRLRCAPARERARRRRSHERLRFLEHTVPVALVEISHGVSVAMGFLLLLVARGLARGYSGSRRVALALFSAGAVATFVKGLDYEEAIVPRRGGALLAVFRRRSIVPGGCAVERILVSPRVRGPALHRRGRGLVRWFPTLDNVFARFETSRRASGWARAVAPVVIATVSALRLSQRSRRRTYCPTDQAIRRALDGAKRYGRNSNAMLVATGTRRCSAGPGRARVHRHTAAPENSWSCTPTPCAAPGREREIFTAFLRPCRDHDREVLLYQLSPALLPVAHDFGFTFFKLGEEAIVDLARFDLKGTRPSPGATRSTRSSAGAARSSSWTGTRSKRGWSELRRVSEAWLADKGSPRRGFRSDGSTRTTFGDSRARFVLDARADSPPSRTSCRVLATRT
jgi:phosphatidylglycerol lysyltransferase